MSTFDPDLLLGSLIAEGGKVCFYPSCGIQLSSVMQLDASIFVFSDYYPRNSDARKRFWQQIGNHFRANRKPLDLVKATVRTRIFRCEGKWGFLFFQDNNEALTRILSAGGKISVFVGINDGCCEGGNYQCVHEEPFVSRLLEGSADHLMYFTNHSSLLEEVYIRGTRHPVFSPWVIHRDRWLFQLHSLIVVPRLSDPDFRVSRQITRQDLEILFHAQGRRIPLSSVSPEDYSSNEFEICKLAGFRGIIARYDVTRLGSDSS